jgi:hypothetical protein
MCVCVDVEKEEERNRRQDVQRQPNMEILEHERKRAIELRVVEWAEEQGIYDQEYEITILKCFLLCFCLFSIVGFCFQFFVVSKTYSFLIKNTHIIVEIPTIQSFFHNDLYLKFIRFITLHLITTVVLCQIL